MRVVDRERDVGRCMCMTWYSRRTLRQGPRAARERGGETTTTATRRGGDSAENGQGQNARPTQRNADS